MAKDNKSKINTVSEIKKYLNRAEFWIGLVTVLLFVVIIGRFAFGRLKNIGLSRKIDQKVFMSPVPSPVGTTPDSQVTPVVTSAPQKSSQLSQIKKFPDTGMVKYQVIDGDSFWTISEKVCGSGIYFESIERQNGGNLRSLQIGDEITVDCSL